MLNSVSGGTGWYMSPTLLFSNDKGMGRRPSQFKLCLNDLCMWQPHCRHWGRPQWQDRQGPCPQGACILVEEAVITFREESQARW